MKEMYMTGRILEVVDPVLYEIKVEVPGVISGITAYPMRGELDEPRVGEIVMIKCLDPVFYSYSLYQKVKEDDFIGFRSNGKLVEITPEAITIGIYDPEAAEWNRDNPRPELTDWIKLSNEGGLEISLRKDTTLIMTGNSSLTIEGNSDITVKGDSSIKSEGNMNIESSGDMTVKGSNITIEKSGKVVLKGTAAPDQSGPFNCIPTCPFSGAPHTGSTVN